MTRIDYVTRRTTTKQVTLAILETFISGLLLMAFVVMSIVILYFIRG